MPRSQVILLSHGVVLLKQDTLSDLEQNEELVMDHRLIYGRITGLVLPLLRRLSLRAKFFPKMQGCVISLMMTLGYGNRPLLILFFCLQKQSRSSLFHCTPQDMTLWYGVGLQMDSFQPAVHTNSKLLKKVPSRPQQATSQGPTLFGSHFGALPSQIKSRCLCGVLANHRFQQKPIYSHVGCYLPVHAQFAMMRMRQFFTLYGIVNMQELYGKIPYYTNSTIPYKYLTGMMSWRRLCGHNDSKILKHFLL